MAAAGPAFPWPPAALPAASPLALLLALPLLFFAAAPARAHLAEPDRFPEIHQRVDELLQQQGLERENVALLLFSTRRRRFLYRLRETQAMIAASNAKLATTFAALRVLGPNYRWKTTIYRVTEQDDTKHGVTKQDVTEQDVTEQGEPAKPARQGLLVIGGGDPTLTSRSMLKIAMNLKTRGLHKVDGALYFDKSLFDDEKYPAAWGNVSGGQSWFAPVSPFIVEKNAAEFLISAGANGAEIEIIPQTPATFLEAVSRLTYAAVPKALVRVTQGWEKQRARFTLSGRIPRRPDIYTVSTAVTDPVAYFFHFLRNGLRRLAIEGEMPLLPASAAPSARERLYTHFSPPLRSLIVDINKESNNLAAEVVVRALALTRNPSPVSESQGLAVLEDALRENFPRFGGQFQMRDGSGLSRETKVSASFMVHLLNRVLSNQQFSAEFLTSLSLGGWDGTLQYRKYPERLQGRLRAKSGTLSGVQNLSGYLHLLNDVVVFSFLINDSKRNFAQLQAAQDRVLTGIFDQLVESAMPRPGLKSGAAKGR